MSSHKAEKFARALSIVEFKMIQLIERSIKSSQNKQIRMQM